MKKPFFLLIFMILLVGIVRGEGYMECVSTGLFESVFSGANLSSGLTANGDLIADDFLYQNGTSCCGASGTASSPFDPSTIDYVNHTQLKATNGTWNADFLDGIDSTAFQLIVGAYTTINHSAETHTYIGNCSIDQSCDNVIYTTDKLGNTTIEIRNQFTGGANISITDGVITINKTFTDSNTTYTADEGNLTLIGTVFHMLKLDLAEHTNSLGWITTAVSTLTNYFTKTETNILLADINDTIDTKLDITDQRYNDTVYIDAVNDSTNINNLFPSNDLTTDNNTQINNCSVDGSCDAVTYDSELSYINNCSIDQSCDNVIYTTDKLFNTSEEIAKVKVDNATNADTLAGQSPATYLDNTDYCSDGTCGGSLVVNGDLTILGDNIIANVTTQTLNGSFLPNINNVFNLGSPSYKWANVYATTFYGTLDGAYTTINHSAETHAYIGNCSVDGSCDDITYDSELSYTSLEGLDIVNTSMLNNNTIIRNHNTTWVDNLIDAKVIEAYLTTILNTVYAKIGILTGLDIVNTSMLDNSTIIRNHNTTWITDNQNPDTTINNCSVEGSCSLITYDSELAYINNCSADQSCSNVIYTTDKLGNTTAEIQAVAVGGDVSGTVGAITITKNYNTSTEISKVKVDNATNSDLLAGQTPDTYLDNTDTQLTAGDGNFTITSKKLYLNPLDLSEHDNSLNWITSASLTGYQLTEGAYAKANLTIDYPDLDTDSTNDYTTTDFNTDYYGISSRYNNNNFTSQYATTGYYTTTNHSAETHAYIDNCSVEGSCSLITYDTELAYIDNCSIDGSCDAVTYDSELSYTSLDGLDIVNTTMLDNSTIIRNHNTSWKVTNATNADTLAGALPSTYLDNTDYCSDGSCDGNLVIDGNLTILGDEVIANVTTQNLNGSFLPNINNVFNIGSSTLNWANVYATTLDGDLGCGNITGATSNLCTLVDTDTTINNCSIDGSCDDITYDSELSYTSLEGLDIVNTSMLNNNTIIRNHNTTWVDNLIDAKVIEAYLTTILNTVYAKIGILTGLDIVNTSMLDNSTIIRNHNTTWITDNQNPDTTINNCSVEGSCSLITYDTELSSYQLVAGAFANINFTTLYYSQADRFTNTNFTTRYGTMGAYAKANLTIDYPDLDTDSTDDVTTSDLETYNTTIKKYMNNTYEPKSTAGNMVMKFNGGKFYIKVT